MTTKNTVVVVGNHGNATAILPPVNRHINPDCTDCCPPLICNSPSDDFCSSGKPQEIDQPPHTPGTGSASPIKLYVDSFGWVDNNCDCSNLNGTFPCALVIDIISIESRPMGWQYTDAFSSFQITGPNANIIRFGGTSPWVLSITSPNINGFIAIYHCDASAFNGCGSAVFQYLGTLNLDGTPGPPPGCLAFPSTIVVRSPEGDPCNCVCNTMSDPAPMVLYLNSNGGNIIVDGIPIQIGYGFTNVQFFKMTGQDFLWYTPPTLGELAGPPTITCCNGKLYWSDYVEGWLQFTGSGCSYTDIINYPNPYYPIVPGQPQFVTVTYTITCDPV